MNTEPEQETSLYMGWTLGTPEAGSYWYTASREGRKALVAMTLQALIEQIERETRAGR